MLAKKYFFPFCKMFENVQIFSFAIKVCKKCYNDLSHFFVKLIVLRILCKFFIKPPPDAQRKERQGAGKGERQGKRNMGLVCCVYCYLGRQF
jgi:hypothetical protein